MGKPKQPDLSYIAEALRALGVPIGDIKPDPENARTHNAGNIRAIAASLRRFGQVKPLVANRTTGLLVAGHGTLEAARSLEWQQIAVVWVELDAGAAHGLAIADNRTAELAGWDQALLDAQLLEVKDSGGDVAALLLDDLAFDLAQKAAPAPVPQKWQVVAQCTDQAQQLEVCELLKARGIQFKLEPARRKPA